MELLRQITSDLECVATLPCENVKYWAFLGSPW